MAVRAIVDSAVGGLDTSGSKVACRVEEGNAPGAELCEFAANAGSVRLRIVSAYSTARNRENIR